MKNTRNIFCIYQAGLIIASLMATLAYAHAAQDCKACLPPTPATLSGRWELEQWSTPTKNESEVHQRDIPRGDSNGALNIQYDQEKNLLSGFSGCNRFMAPLEFNKNNSIKVGLIAGTQMLCMENSRMELERDFLNELSNSESWGQDGTKLIMTSTSGEVLTFERR